MPRLAAGRIAWAILIAFLCLSGCKVSDSPVQPRLSDPEQAAAPAAEDNKKKAELRPPAALKRTTAPEKRKAPAPAVKPKIDAKPPTPVKRADAPETRKPPAPVKVETPSPEPAEAPVADETPARAAKRDDEKTAPLLKTEASVPAAESKKTLPERASDTLWLGLRVQELTPELSASFDLPEKTRGVLVAGVHPGSPAKAADIRVGDILLTLDGRVIRDLVDLPGILGGHQTGDRLSLTLLREKTWLPFELTVASRPN